MRTLLLIALAGAAACATDGARPAADSAAGAVGALSPDTVATPGAARTDSGAAAPATASGLASGSPVIRALYVNRWATQSRTRMKVMIDIADTTEINALVLDMKDEFGLNYNPTNPEFARYAGTATKVSRLKELLDTLRAHDILPIARMVVFKDSVAARLNPEWTIRRPDGSAWRDRKGLAWVNPYHKELWEYNIGVAEELVKLGFGEIQWDYIRFPEPYASLPKQTFPGAGEKGKPQALAEFLELAKRRLNALGVRSTADIFGLVTTVRGPLEIGQHWERVAPVTDVLLPMVYPSHYPRGSFGISHPNAEPYRIIKIAIDSARVRNEKLGITTPEHVRPWIQAFTLGAPAYGAEEIRQQKKAIYDAGYKGWVLWSPGSRYEIFLPALEKEIR